MTLNRRLLESHTDYYLQKIQENTKSRLLEAERFLLKLRMIVLRNGVPQETEIGPL